ncbi:MAG: hypothetical protein HC896_01005 [Bacteroidales bacterium]|nr:hypothetical protein [Bacteroidales bacterium]
MGVLEWYGKDYRYVHLHDIPHHARFNIGDTVVTSGFSIIFPENLLIGSIVDFSLKGGNFYTIKVALFADMKKLTDVYVVKNLNRNEIDSLEISAAHD